MGVKDVRGDSRPGRLITIFYLSFTQFAGWVAECHSCGTLGVCGDLSKKGRKRQHNGRNRQYCGYFMANPRWVKNMQIEILQAVGARRANIPTRTLMAELFPLPCVPIEFSPTRAYSGIIAN